MRCYSRPSAHEASHDSHQELFLANVETQVRREPSGRTAFPNFQSSLSQVIYCYFNIFTVPDHSVSFKAKRARSSSHGREPASPLSPCLVHRSPSSSHADGNIPRRLLERRPSLPNSPPLDTTGRPLATVPLRSCCPDCMEITEECLKEGEAWVERFTRGARRRRNSSASESDSGFTPVESKHHGHKDVAVVRLGSSASITVDEVDQRRKSREIDPNTLGSASSPINVPSAHSVSAIVEEDEDQLFPLPSPRRSPNSSPANSATPSPNASSCQLGESPNNIPDEGILATSFTRKGRCEKGLLTPEADGELLPSAPKCVPPEDALPTPVSPPYATPIDLPSPVSCDSPPSPVSTRSKSHSRSPERTRPKERRPSFGANVLRATGDMLKGVSLGNPGSTVTSGLSV